VLQVYYSSDIIVPFDLFVSEGLMVDLTLVFDFARLAFGALVLAISLRVCIYSLSYIFHDPRIAGFYILVFSFVISIIILIVVGSYLPLLLG
jgi:NADH:ubiquinone oxidoreductase subunit 5 (subunit L)/multisubunit Na+/H+ antiporter MnhA subunit